MSDEGKQVVTHDNELIGEVVEVGDHAARVDPDPDLSDTAMSRLGWGGDEDTYWLDYDQIDAVVKDQVRIKPH
jgi:hypothetical protein